MHSQNMLCTWESGVHSMPSFPRKAATITPILTPKRKLFPRAQMLSAIVYTLRDKAVDAVLFMDRLDSYRVDASDVQAWFRVRARAHRCCLRS